MKIDGAVAVFTGGASGLERFRRALHEGGVKVVLIGLPSSNGLDAAAKISEGAHFAAADVTSADDVAKAVDFAADLGDLRIAVNCAGVATPGQCSRP